MTNSLFSHPWPRRDQVALITGAGKGSGRILAQALAERGAIVAANDISPVNVEEVVDQIVAKGGRAKAYIDDIAKKVAAQNIINEVEDDFGRIDILINHAAAEPHVPLLDMDEWDWHRVLDVNLTGAFLMIQSVGRVMREKGQGVIINIVPEAGLEVRNDGGAYASSMAGLRALSDAAGRELSQFGIRVWAVENHGPEKVVETVLSLLEKEER